MVGRVPPLNEPGDSIVSRNWTSLLRWRPAGWPPFAVGLMLGAVLTVAAAWLIPEGRTRLQLTFASSETVKAAPEGGEAGGHDHAGHQHGHDSGDALEISSQAQSNIGLKTTRIELGPFERNITLPAIVVERPGRSELDVTAALSGIVLKIYPIRGQAVAPGQPLFDLRLTHEELVQGQTEFLRAANELDIVKREVARLEPLEATGSIALKTILDRRYEQQKLDALLRSQRQGLYLHGLRPEQVDQILASRELLPGLTISVPKGKEEDKAGKSAVSQAASTEEQREMFQVQELMVERGQYVNAGDRLCVLSDHAELYIEGKAFEQDAETLNQLANKGWTVTAVFEGAEGKSKLVPGLELLYVSDKVEVESRTLRFFVRLPNRLVRDWKTPDGQRFVGWEYRPGQRLQLQVPVERWTDRIVLPADAAVQDGVDWYVFQRNGKRFQRRAVHVEHRDPLWVVIANDGSLFPGDEVAISGAQQIQMALKNKAGGAIDPHAGHNH